MNKSLKDISWQVTEEQYRMDKALSYSTLSSYERGGFEKLPTLFDKIETPSLTFGSAVDSIITGGMDEFEDRFVVADFPNIQDSIIKVVKALYETHKATAVNLEDISDKDVISMTEMMNYQMNWKPQTRVANIKEKGSEYYNLLFISEGKSLINSELYTSILDTVNALKTSEATKWFFEDDSPFEPELERLYQLKFKGKIEGIYLRCMAD